MQKPSTECQNNFSIPLSRTKVLPFLLSKSPKIHSQKNSPLSNGQLSLKNSPNLHYSAGAFIKTKKVSADIPMISTFEIQDLENLVPENSGLTNEGIKRLCRICLDSDNMDDMISPCACRGFQKFVHQGCLKLWLVKSERIDAQLNICEVCKEAFVMQFEYSAQFAPCSEVSCRAWLPGLVFVIMFSFIVCFIMQGYIDNSSRGLVMFAVSIIFGLIGLLSLVFALSNIKRVCLQRKISVWKILSKSQY